MVLSDKGKKRAKQTLAIFKHLESKDLTSYAILKKRIPIFILIILL